jgi:hypothetical protein
MDPRVLDQEVERLLLPEAPLEAIEVAALLHHTANGRRGALRCLREPLYLCIDLAFRGVDGLLLGNGFQEKGSVDRLLALRP